MANKQFDEHPFKNPKEHAQKSCTIARIDENRVGGFVRLEELPKMDPKISVFDGELRELWKLESCQGLEKLEEDEVS